MIQPDPNAVQPEPKSAATRVRESEKKNVLTTLRRRHQQDYLVGGTLCLNVFKTAVPFWGQTA